jgi:hypothetical protein
MFLPDYLLKGFDSTTIDNRSLVLEKRVILPATLEANKASFLSPFVLYSLFFVLIAAMSFLKTLNGFFAVFDFVLFFLAGALGLLILFMWFGTDHQACRNNLNIVWASPLHFIVVFVIYRKRAWLGYYFLANGIILMLLLVSWKWLPQEMNNALLPIVALLMLRSFMRYKKMNYAAKNIEL